MFFVGGFTKAALAGAGVTYQGRLIGPNGQPVRSSSVTFRVQIRTPGAENCLLYEEQQVKDLSSSSGVFALTLNDGSAAVMNTEPFAMDRLFQNRGSFTFGAGKCVGGSIYNPSPTDGRLLVVDFNDGSFSGWESMPAQAVNFVPLALESVSVGGFSPSSLARVVDAFGAPAPVAAFTQTQHQALLDLANGSSTAYLSGTSPLNAANLADGSVGDAKILAVSGSKVTGNITGNAAGFTGSLTGDVTGTQSATLVTKIQGRAVDTSAPANGQALVWDAADNRWEPGTVSGGGAADWSTLTGKPATFPSDWATTANKPATFPSDWATLASKPTTFAPAAHSHPVSEITSGVGSYFNYSPNGTACAAGEVLKWDAGSGGRWICGTDAGSAGTLVSLTTNAPIVKTGTTSDPVLSISEASTSAKGVVQLAASSDTTANLVVQANDTRLTDSRAPNGVAGGDLGGNYPNPTIAKLQTKDVTLAALASGDVLKYDGVKWVNAQPTDGDTLGGLSCSSGDVALYSGSVWTCVNASVSSANNAIVRRNGSGQIQSAAADLGSLLLNNGGGSTVTVQTPAAFTSYTLKLPAGTGTNGQILTSNGTDMIWSGASSITAGNVSGIVAVANGGTGAATASAARTAIGAMADVAPGTSGNVLTSTGTSWVSGAVPADVNKVSKTGDTMSGSLTLSAGSVTVPANGLVVGTDQLVASGGNVGIGSASPAAKLDVNGAIRAQSLCDETGANCKDISAGWSVPATPGGSDGQVQFNGGGALAGSANFAWDNTTSRLRLGGSSAPSYDLSFGGTASRTVGVESVANSGGADLIIQAGGATGTNRSGGVLSLRAGAASGTGSSSIEFQTATAGSSGTATRTPSTKVTIEESGSVAVAGQVATGSFTTSTANVDWNLGNAASSSYSCSGNISFANLRDGGSYTLVVTNTGTTQCNFSTTTTGVNAGTVSYRITPANAARTASSHTIYSLIRVGSIVYVSWISGL